jgi:hypothetical protein
LKKAPWVLFSFLPHSLYSLEQVRVKPTHWQGFAALAQFHGELALLVPDGPGNEAGLHQNAAVDLPEPPFVNLSD